MNVIVVPLLLGALASLILNAGAAFSEENVGFVDLGRVSPKLEDRLIVQPSLLSPKNVTDNIAGTCLTCKGSNRKPRQSFLGRFLKRSKRSSGASSSLGTGNSTSNTTDACAAAAHVHAPEILYIFLTLIIGAIAKYVLKLVRHRFVLPYTVFVLILGCIYGALSLPSCVVQVFTSIGQADPNVILLTFLPALIYEAAFTMQTHLFKKLFFHMALIGTLGLAINVIAVAYISTEVFSSTPGWTIHVGLLFSAIVSATDPVAAVALLHEAGTAKTLMVVLEGTSLLSDTSAVVLFNLFIALLHISDDASVDVATQIGNFALNIFGGPAWGLCVGFLLTQLLSRMSSVWEAELILILSVPYLVFWSADSGFKISGALATAVLGLWMSSHRTSISPDVEQLVNRIWELVALISNTLIFSLVGVIIVDTAMNHVTKSDWILLIIINLFIMLVRGASFLLLKPLLTRIGIGARVFTWPHTFVMIWAGFKGAVTLALGILGAKDSSFDNYLEVRSKLLFHSAGVVAFTLLFNATTMRFFLKRLGILDMPMSKMITMHMALKQILLTRHQKLEALKTDRYLADADWERVEDLTRVEGKHYGIEDDGQTSLWTIHYVTREVICPSCQAEVQLEPLPNELAEMENIGRLRLVNAKKILLTRHQKLEALKTDRYLADADWERVEDLTRVEGKHYGIEDDGQTSLWTIHYVTREVICPSCQAEVQLEPLPNELAEMENIGRLRLVNAKKTSYWRQYEEGTLSQNGIKQLDDISDTVLSADHGVIDHDDIKKVLKEEQWTALKHQMANFQNWINRKEGKAPDAPRQRWRRPFHRIAISTAFTYAVYVIICANVAETIADWAVRQDNSPATVAALNGTDDITTAAVDFLASTAENLPTPAHLIGLMKRDAGSTDSGGPDYHSDDYRAGELMDESTTSLVTETAAVTGTSTSLHMIFLYTNIGFAILYTLEALIKIIGLGWKNYWGKGYWLSWNRFDFLLLWLTYIDIILDFIAEYGDGQIKGVASSKPFSASLIRIFRFFRLIRFGRALKLMQPLIPRIVRFLDRRINAHLFLAYDVAKAFIVAQEECSMMVPTIIGYKPLATKFKTQADVDCRIILKEMGLLNEQRPDVAAAVKTRQAIRSILNHLHKSVEHMRNQGILDEDEVNHLQTTIEDRLKRLHHFPHSIAVIRPLDRLWNVPWINGNMDAFTVMKVLFEERQYNTATQLMTANEEADGIYVVVSGVVSLSYGRTFSDNMQLGEIYNSDNLRTPATDEEPDEARLDYVLAGGILNEQSLALDFPRRSHVVSDTIVGLLYLDAESLFRSLSTLPMMEARFWRRIASSVALNILIKAGSITDSTFETEKTRLARAAVRLVRPHVRITGLEEFDEVFLITGTLTDMSTDEDDEDKESIIGPLKVPPTFREVEVTQGRRAVTTKKGHLIYPEYAVLFLVPPAGRDLSMLNIHDSQTNVLERRNTTPGKVFDMIRSSIVAQSNTELPSFVPSIPNLDPTVQKKSLTGRRGSNMGAMLQYGRRQSTGPNATMINLLGYGLPGDQGTESPPRRERRTLDTVAEGEAEPKVEERRDSPLITEPVIDFLPQDETKKRSSSRKKAVHEDWW